MEMGNGSGTNKDPELGVMVFRYIDPMACANRKIAASERPYPAILARGGATREDFVPPYGISTAPTVTMPVRLRELP